MGEELSPSEGIRTVNRIKSVKGVFNPPGDEFISHLALVVGALAEGVTTVKGLSRGQNVERTLECLQALGVEIRRGGINDTVTISGSGACGNGSGFETPVNALECGNSSTTVELMAGLLVGQGIRATLVGSERLSSVQMEGMVEPLRTMGAEISLMEGGTLPIKIESGTLSGATFKSPVCNPGQKASVILAGLGSTDPVEYSEPQRTADHAEKMLKLFGATLESRTRGGGRSQYTVRIEPGSTLTGREIEVPGDLTSALYLAVAALLLPRSDLMLKNVGLNPGRREAIKVLTRMGGRIEISNRRVVNGESVGDLKVGRSRLRGTGLSGSSARWLINEIPAMSVAAAFAEGETYIKGVEELRHKGTDRIAALVHNLKVLGLDVGESPDGLVFRGKQTHDGGEFNSFGDYRIALAFHICGIACHGESTILDYDVIEEFWPDFPEVMEALKI